MVYIELNKDRAKLNMKKTHAMLNFQYQFKGPTLATTTLGRQGHSLNELHIKHFYQARLKRKNFKKYVTTFNCTFHANYILIFKVH